MIVVEKPIGQFSREQGASVAGLRRKISVRKDNLASLGKFGFVSLEGTQESIDHREVGAMSSLDW